jgi:hypothetical protein
LTQFENEEEAIKYVGTVLILEPSPILLRHFSSFDATGHARDNTPINAIRRVTDVVGGSRNDYYCYRSLNDETVYISVCREGNILTCSRVF